MQVIDPDLEGGFAVRPTIPKKTLTSNFFLIDDDDLLSGCRNVSQYHYKQSFSAVRSPW